MTMRLHLIVLAALIAFAVSDSKDECQVMCKNDSKEMSQYCVKERDCYMMIPQCMVEQIKCFITRNGQDPAEVLATFEDNCKDKKPMCNHTEIPFVR